MGTDGLESVEQMLSVCAPSMTLPGVDVSHWDGTIAWGTVAGAGIKWGYAKATESTNYQDPTFATNWSGMKNAGVVRGAYHFFHPDVSGRAQADYFLNFVGAIDATDLPPMLDWEVSNGASGATAAANAQAFIDQVRARTGRKTVIYTSPGLWGGFGVTQSFAADPLWVAHYLYCTSGAGCCPTMPTGWTTWIAWQWSDRGMVAGFPAGTNVDLDLFYGDTNALNAFIASDRPDGGVGGGVGGGAGGGTGGGTGGGAGGGAGGGTGGGAGGGAGGGSAGGTGGTGGGASGGGAGGGTGGAGAAGGGSGGGTEAADGGNSSRTVGSCGCATADGFSLMGSGFLAFALLRRRRNS